MASRRVTLSPWQQGAAAVPALAFFAGSVAESVCSFALWPHQAFYWLAAVGVLTPVLVACLPGRGEWRVVLLGGAIGIGLLTLFTTATLAHRADDVCTQTAPQGNPYWGHLASIDLARGEIVCAWSVPDDSSDAPPTAETRAPAVEALRGATLGR